MVVDMNYWSKVLRRILIVVITMLGVYLAFKLAIFYLPFLIAFIIALLIEPLIRKVMKKTKLRRKPSAIIVLILVFSIIIGLIVWGTITLVSEASNLLQDLNGYFEKAYTQVKDIISHLDFSKWQMSEDITKIIQDAAFDLLGTISEWLKHLLTSVLNWLTSVPTIGIYTGIALIALYFMSTDKIFMIDQLEHHLPSTWVKRLGKHLRDLIKILGCYLKAQAILIIVSFFISLIGLYILYFMGFNVPFPLIAALAIGFVDALPILGSGSIMLPWAIISAVNGDLNLAIGILVIWCIMSLVRQFIEPRVVGNQIGIHPIFTLIAMYTGFKFIGILGMLIGPIILIILKNIFSTLIDNGILKSIFDRN